MTDSPLTIRNYRPSDFDNLVRLYVETGLLDRTVRHVSTESLAEDLGRPNYVPENDLFVAEIEGKIIGYISVNLELGISRALMGCLVHPRHRRKGTATSLFTRAQQRAGEAGVNVVQVSIAETNVTAKSLMPHLGLRFIRRFFELKLDIYNIQSAAVNPGPFKSRVLRRGEEDQLTELQNRSFAGTWGFNPNTTDEIVYRLNMGSCSPEDVIMTYVENTPVAYCWTKVDPEANVARGENRGQIHMLGVDPGYRQKGIGKNVLLAGLSGLKRKGIDIVELTVDSENPEALALYESVGFEMYSRTEWYEKKLT